RYFSYSQKYARAATTARRAAAMTYSAALPANGDTTMDNSAATIARRAATNTHPFIQSALIPLEANEETSVDIAEMIRFFGNPAEYFLKRRLQVAFPRRGETIGDSELFSMGSLNAYLLKQQLLAIQLERGLARAEYERVAASGVLPHGAAGLVAFADMCSDVELFAAQVAALRQGRRLPDLKIDLEVDNFRLTGALSNVYDDALLFYRMAVMKPKDYLSAWISHLALLVSDTRGYPTKTICCSFANSKMVEREFAPVKDPYAKLKTLVMLYGAGHSAPLKFFPHASRRYVDVLVKSDRSEQEALDAARRAWRESYSGAQAEADNEYIRQCFQDVDPFDDEFAQTAELIYQPILHATARWKKDDETADEEAGAESL
ncbi:MAG TPA: hypothetical protein VK470_12690, partial [Bacteroidota bacterium]|nr:hypothetical protein [Bacteroidota bacterium]